MTWESHLVKPDGSDFVFVVVLLQVELEGAGQFEAIDFRVSAHTATKIQIC